MHHYIHDTTIPTARVQIFISGPIEVAKQTLRFEALREGICVTIEPTTFIYTGGEEAGYVVGLIDYPRFPWGAEKLLKRAEFIAGMLLIATCQQSAMIVTPQSTRWISNRT